MKAYNEIIGKEVSYSVRDFIPYYTIATKNIIKSGIEERLGLNPVKTVRDQCALVCRFIDKYHGVTEEERLFIKHYCANVTKAWIERYYREHLH